MKQIEGQTLLSIQQYFPTGYLRMAKKSQGMMNLFVENISEKVRKGIMDYDFESSSLEINNQAKTLFTLTAKEVEIVQSSLLCLLKEYDATEKELDQVFNMLTRIKQWKDERDSK